MCSRPRWSRRGWLFCDRTVATGADPSMERARVLHVPVGGNGHLARKPLQITRGLLITINIAFGPPPPGTGKYWVGQTTLFLTY
jgi:hypothetical protein